MQYVAAGRTLLECAQCTTAVLRHSLRQHQLDGHSLPSVLVHGDLWLNNVLMASDEHGKPGSKVHAFIDWQAVHPGSPAEDLARLMSSSVQASVLRAHTDEILHAYHDALAAASPDGRAPFEYDEFKT